MHGRPGPVRRKSAAPATNVPSLWGCDQGQAEQVAWEQRGPGWKLSQTGIAGGPFGTRGDADSERALAMFADPRPPRDVVHLHLINTSW